MVKSEPYGTEADVYCLGIVLYELFYFKSPFHASNKDNMFKNIKEGSVKFNEKTRVIPNDAKELITLLLKGKNERPKIEEVLKHPFVEKYHFGKD